MISALDHDRLHQLLAAKDPRFDGVFYIGVKTTGVYCRPICPAPPVKSKNCVFFHTAAAAEEFGFRPCLRCRPELAPGLAPTESTRRQAYWAAARLGIKKSLEALADEMGITTRHLRRVIRAEFGVSPIQLAQTRRLLLAKQLLTETQLPMTDVAFAAGFRSVRRFNAALQSGYRLKPTDIRKQTKRPASTGITLKLMCRPPFAGSELLRFMSDRAIAGVESMTRTHYCRSISIGKHRGWLAVEMLPTGNGVLVKLAPELATEVGSILPMIRRAFDLDARPDAIADHLGSHEQFRKVIKGAPGLRIPGSMCGFEILWRAILGQQISVSAATTVAGRFARAFGESIETPIDCVTHLTPTPERIAEASRDDIARLGIIAARADAIRAAAKAIAEGGLKLDGSGSPEEMIQQLKELPGVGDWTAQYVALRTGWPDAFPAGDLVIRRSLGDAKPKHIETLAEAWRPWRSYAALYLWHAYGNQKGE